MEWKILKLTSKQLKHLKVVSNASPLIHLSRIGRLNLLHDMFDTVSIPGAVENEILRGKNVSDGFASAIEVEEAINAGWIRIEKLRTDEHKLTVKYSYDPAIHAGEADVLAMGHRFDLLLLDDLGARVFAKALGFKILGTIGLILQAYNIELISFAEFEECLDDLEHYDFWLHPHLKRRIMTEAELIKQRREHVD